MVISQARGPGKKALSVMEPENNPFIKPKPLEQDPDRWKSKEWSEFVWGCSVFGDEGNGKLFALLFRHNTRRDPGLGFIVREDGEQHWKVDITNLAMSRVAEVGTEYHHGNKHFLAMANNEKKGNEKKLYEKKADDCAKAAAKLRNIPKIESCLKAACFSRPHPLNLNGNEINSEAWGFPVDNGVIDLKTGEVWPTDEEIFIDGSPVKYEGCAVECPKWEAFLKDILEHDAVVDWLQRFLGMSLTTSVKNHALVVFLGRGRNGKSVLIDVMRHIFGGLSHPLTKNVFAFNSNPNPGAPTPHVLEFRGKRLTWLSELKGVLDESFLKLASGADALSGTAKYEKNPVVFNPTHKTILISNDEPRLPANDYATRKRLRIIRFEKSFVENSVEEFERLANPDLVDELKAEGAGILAWLVRGCLFWQERGLADIPNEIQLNVETFYESIDDIGRFIEECCDLREFASVQSGALLLRYQEWCKTNGLKPQNATRFRKYCNSRFKSEKPNKRHTYYLGVDILGE